MKLEPLDTPAKQAAYRNAEIALSMRVKYPESRLWRWRARLALEAMEKIWGKHELHSQST